MRVDRELLRRDFMLGAGALLLSACRAMSHVRTADVALSRPHPDDWQPVLQALVTTILPFEHAAFPDVRPEAVHAELLELFPIDRDPELESVPVGLLVFDDCAAFDAPFAPFVEDERLDLQLRAAVQTPASSAALDRALDAALAADRAAFDAQRPLLTERFSALPLASRRAYLQLWGESALIARRRVYRGWKGMVTISAYSTRPFWNAVGYEGPLLG